MHSFNDSVVYVRNGKPIPAIVLSSLQSDRGELLTVLYAQPEIGPTLLAQGTTRGVAQVQQAVTPFVEGNVFGWEDTFASDLRAWKARPKPTIAELEAILNEEGEFPIKINPDGSISADLPEGHAALAADIVFGPVQPGAPESPHAIIQHDVPGRAAYDQANRDIAGLSDGGDPEPSVTYAQGSQS